MAKYGIKGVLIDWDGTLVDSNFLYINAFERVFKEKGIKYNKKELLSMFGIPTKKIIKHFLLKNNLPSNLAEHMTKRFYEFIKEELKKNIKKIKLREGVEEFLVAAKKRGIKVFVITGNEEGVVEGMAKQLGIHDYIDKIYGFFTLKHPKPSPLVIEQVVKENRINKDEVLFIGDTEVDRKTAENAGVEFIGIDSGMPLSADKKYTSFFPLLLSIANTNEKYLFLITGLAGAGKTTARDILTSLLNLPYIRFGGITDDILKKRGLENNEENNKKIRDEIRAKYGMGGYALLSLPKIEKSLEQNHGLIIDGVYSWEEVEIIKNHFSSTTKANKKTKITLLAVVADKELRYKRLENRKGRRWSREEARKRDEHEVMELNKGTTISMADYFICNNRDEKYLEERVKEIVKTFLLSN